MSSFHNVLEILVRRKKSNDVLVITVLSMTHYVPITELQEIIRALQLQLQLQFQIAISTLFKYSRNLNLKLSCIYISPEHFIIQFWLHFSERVIVFLNSCLKVHSSEKNIFSTLSSDSSFLHDIISFRKRVNRMSNSQRFSLQST